MSQADLLASEPGPGEAFNEGSTCRIGWVGDDSGSTTWKTMTIELMTGSNLAMVSLLSTHPCFSPVSIFFIFIFTSVFEQLSLLAWMGQPQAPLPIPAPRSVNPTPGRDSRI